MAAKILCLVRTIYLLSTSFFDLLYAAVANWQKLAGEGPSHYMVYATALSIGSITRKQNHGPLQTASNLIEENLLSSDTSSLQ